MKKALQVIGIVALVAWTGAGGYAWSKVKTKIDVTIREKGDAEDGELALLRDRFDTLSGDLDLLVTSLEENFGLLAQALEQEGEASAVSAARTEERLRHLEAALPAALEARETAGALASVLARLEAIDLTSFTAGGHAFDRSADHPPTELSDVIDPGNASDAPDAPGASESLEVEDEPAPPVVPAEPVAETPSEPAPKRGFLAFKLPSRDFQFEGEQTFEVLTDLSRVGFDAKSTLHDFTGVSNRASGSFRVDLAHPGKGITGRIAIPTTSLDTGLDGRDEAMLENLGADSHDEITFVATGFDTGKVDVAAQTVEGTLQGEMTIRGETKPVRMAVQAHVDESRRLVVEGEMPLLLPDYGVPVPNKLGMITMNKEVRVWIRFRARAKAEGASR